MSAERRRRVLTRQLFSDAYAAEHPDDVLAHLERLGAHRATPGGAVQHLAASLVHDTVSRLPYLQVPTLVLHGGLDRMVPVANGRLLAARVPRARLEVVAESGHLPQLEQPERVRELLTRWWNEVAGSAPRRPLPRSEAALEPVTRALGLPVGAARTCVSAWHVAMTPRTPRSA